MSATATAHAISSLNEPGLDMISIDLHRSNER